LLELYARIMQERFAGRVTLQREIAEDTLDAEVPSMLLQPLLENAFKHGVECSGTQVIIGIAARRDDAALHVLIRNTGRIQAGSHGAGIGLRNGRERLALLYGDRASLELLQEGDVVCVRLMLPHRSHAA
jgi:LytS/YehU family sensor histidine kinase